MKKYLLLIAVLLPVVLVADILWDFNSDTEGWDIADLTTNGPYYPPIDYYQVTYVESGGDSGGYISGHDPSSNTFSFRMPENIFDSIQTFENGNITFSLKSSANNWTSEPYLILVANNEVLISEFELPTNVWRTYSIDFVKENFYEYNGGGEPSEEYFSSFMQNINHIYISAEFGSGVFEDTDLDSVVLSGITEVSLSSPNNVEISVENNIVTLNWDPVSGALFYKVFYSDSPNGTFIDVSNQGTFSGPNWTASISSNKGFYYIKAAN